MNNKKKMLIEDICWLESKGFKRVNSEELIWSNCGECNPNEYCRVRALLNGSSVTWECCVTCGNGIHLCIVVGRTAKEAIETAYERTVFLVQKIFLNVKECHEVETDVYSIKQLEFHRFKNTDSYTDTKANSSYKIHETDAPKTDNDFCHNPCVLCHWFDAWNCCNKGVWQADEVNGRKFRHSYVYWSDIGRCRKEECRGEGFERGGFEYWLAKLLRRIAKFLENRS